MSKLKVSIVGTRGIPANYGGFETFAQEVATLLAQQNITITVYCDYQEEPPLEKLQGVQLKYSKTTKSKNPLLYYYDTIRKSLKHSDIVLIAGTGGSLFYFLNIFKRRVIITNCDGLESRRQKWSFLKRNFIRLTEIVAVKASNAIIADSKGIEQYLKEHYRAKYHSKIHTIEYGAHEVTKADESYIKALNLKPNEYFLVVSRLEPENNIHTIISGFKKLNSPYPLVIVGGLLDNDYVNELQYSQSEKIIFLGGIYDSKKLDAVRYYSTAYIHGHSVGGTNPSLLEAMASGNICVCHDNIFNREVTDNEMYYFKNADELTTQLDHLLHCNENEKIGKKKISIDRIKNYYNWPRITQEYVNLFEKIH